MLVSDITGFGLILKQWDGYRIIPTTSVYGVIKLVWVLPGETVLKCVVECYSIPNCFAFNWRSDLQMCELANYFWDAYFGGNIDYEVNEYTSWYERQL